MYDVKSIRSFSYYFGQEGEIPDGTIVYDCRMLPDPEGNLKGTYFDGTDVDVQTYVFISLLTQDTLADAKELARQGEQHFAFGCSAGKNRSVAMAEVFAREVGFEGEIEHMNLRYWRGE